METTRAIVRRAAVLAVIAAAPLPLMGQNSPFVTYTPEPPSDPEIVLTGSLAKTQIDPEYATLYGGNGYDEMLAKVIGRNATCMVGVTSSTNLTLFSPFQASTGGGFDGWIGCGDLYTGLPFFASYFGLAGAETITGADIYRDTLFVVGVTSSPTMPGAGDSYQEASGGGQDCFIARMSAFDGSGLKTTLFGSEGDEYCGDISVGRKGVWIGGTTNKIIDLVNPLQSVVKGDSDGLLALLDRKLTSLRFATLIGGDDADGLERIAVKHYYDHDYDEQSKFDDVSTVEPPARVYFTGWSRGPGGPVTPNAYQSTHGGGLDAVYGYLDYDFDAVSASLGYYSYAGKSGDEVPRDMGIGRYGVSFTGWTTSNGWNTSGRARNSGTSDGFLFSHPSVGDTTAPYVGYVGPSNSYNLPLAFAGTRPGISVVAGYTAIPATGNAFMQAYDRDYSLIGTQFAGGNAPADFNTVEVNPFFWAGGGKTGEAIPTTPLAIQTTYGGGDFDMFGSKYRAPWGYQFIYNLTDDDLTVERNGSLRDPILARSPGRVDALGWNLSYSYTFSRPSQTYNIDRLLDETSQILNYTYIFNDQVLSVAVPQVDRKEIGILAYNELGRAVDIVRLDQTIEHNEISRTMVEAGQFFYIPLPREQNFRITDGLEFIDYNAPKKGYHSDFPYYAGVLQTRVEKGTGAQDFELVLFNANGAPVEIPVVTAVEDEGVIPSEIALHSNHPNPFNESTTISFQTPNQASVRLTVFDVMGRRVQTLANGMYPPGRSLVEWNGRSESGAAMASGTYLVRLEVEGFSVTRSMILAR